MNLLKCEQYFYLLLSGKEKFRSSKGNQRSREKDNYTYFSPPQRQPAHSPAGCWSQHRPGGVWAHALHDATRTADAPLPQQWPSVNIWYTAKALPWRKRANNLWKNKLLFKNIHGWKGLIFLSSNNPVPKAPGLSLNMDKTILGVCYMVWSVLSGSFTHSFLSTPPTWGA